MSKPRRLSEQNDVGVSSTPRSSMLRALKRVGPPLALFATLLGPADKAQAFLSLPPLVPEGRTEMVTNGSSPNLNLEKFGLRLVSSNEEVTPSKAEEVSVLTRGKPFAGESIANFVERIAPDYSGNPFLVSAQDGHIVTDLKRGTDFNANEEYILCASSTQAIKASRKIAPLRLVESTSSKPAPKKIISNPTASAPEAVAPSASVKYAQPISGQGIVDFLKANFRTEASKLIRAGVNPQKLYRYIYSEDGKQLLNNQSLRVDRKYTLRIDLLGQLSVSTPAPKVSAKSVTTPEISKTFAPTSGNVISLVARLETKPEKTISAQQTGQSPRVAIPHENPKLSPTPPAQKTKSTKIIPISSPAKNFSPEPVPITSYEKNEVPVLETVSKKKPITIDQTVNHVARRESFKDKKLPSHVTSLQELKQIAEDSNIYFADRNVVRSFLGQKLKLPIKQLLDVLVLSEDLQEKEIKLRVTSLGRKALKNSDSLHIHGQAIDFGTGHLNARQAQMLYRNLYAVALEINEHFGEPIVELINEDLRTKHGRKTQDWTGHHFHFGFRKASPEISVYLAQKTHGLIAKQQAESAQRFAHLKQKEDVAKTQPAKSQSIAKQQAESAQRFAHLKQKEDVAKNSQPAASKVVQLSPQKKFPVSATRTVTRTPTPKPDERIASAQALPHPRLVARTEERKVTPIHQEYFSDVELKETLISLRPELRKQFKRVITAQDPVTQSDLARDILATIRRGEINSPEEYLDRNVEEQIAELSVKHRGSMALILGNVWNLENQDRIFKVVKNALDTKKANSVEELIEKKIAVLTKKGNHKTAEKLRATLAMLERAESEQLRKAA